tara:strand:+ start:512 stop:1351 length:840 start_codon:yes stop_codon:yes gene_type:complete
LGGFVIIKLYIIADDFGIAENVNSAIVSLLNKKSITHTSAIVCGPSINHAIKMLDKRFFKRVGLHLCLDSEKPISNVDDIPSLIDKKTNKFFSRGKFILKALSGSINKHELEKEICLQIEKLLSFGIKPHHIDGHGHLHVLPIVSKLLKNISIKYGINKIRKPLEHNLFASMFDNINRSILAIGISFFAYWSFKRHLKDLNTSDYFKGLINSGNISDEVLIKLINECNDCKDSSFELMCHPGFNDKNKYSFWNLNWQKEYDALIKLGEHISKNNHIKLA